MSCDFPCRPARATGGTTKFIFRIGPGNFIPTGNHVYPRCFRPPAPGKRAAAHPRGWQTRFHPGSDAGGAVARESRRVGVGSYERTFARNLTAGVCFAKSGDGIKLSRWGRVEFLDPRFPGPGQHWVCVVAGDGRRFCKVLAPLIWHGTRPRCDFPDFRDEGDWKNRFSGSGLSRFAFKGKAFSGFSTRGNHGPHGLGQNLFVGGGICRWWGRGLWGRSERDMHGPTSLAGRGKVFFKRAGGRGR